MNKDTFSWPRLRAYIVKTFMENRGTYGIMALIAIACGLLFTLVFPQLFDVYGDISDIHNYDYDPMVNYESYFFALMFYVWLIATGCMFFSAVATKGDRIQQFTLPVSNLEKCTTYFLIYTVALTVLFLAAVFLADTIRTIVYSNSSSVIRHLSLRDVFCFINRNDEQTEWLLFGVFSLLSTHSIFVLGSILWSKYTFLKTTGAYLAIQTLVGIAATCGMQTLLLIAPGYSHISVPKPTIQHCLLSFQALVVIFCFAVAYLRFREQETINRW